MFKSRVRQVYGLDSRTPFEIWLHPCRAARAGPGPRARRDRVGLRVRHRRRRPRAAPRRPRGRAGRRARARPADGDVETIYDARTTGSGGRQGPAGGRPSVPRATRTSATPSACRTLVATYKTAFCAPVALPRGLAAQGQDGRALHVPARRGDDDVPRHVRRPRARDFHDSILEEPSILRRFVAPAPPARPPTTSTSRADFVAFPQGPKRAPAPRALDRRRRTRGGNRRAPRGLRRARALRRRASAPASAPSWAATASAAPSPPRFATTTRQGHFWQAAPGSRKIFAEPVTAPSTTCPSSPGSLQQRWRNHGALLPWPRAWSSAVLVSRGFGAPAPGRGVPGVFMTACWYLLSRTAPASPPEQWRSWLST